MEDSEQSALRTAARDDAPAVANADRDGLVSVDAIGHMTLAEVRKHLEALAQERLRAGIGPEETVRYHALCRREDELLRGKDRGVNGRL
ncbi:MAG: hypothetical protein ACYDA2_10680 [Acidimicrobiales bacterium]